MALEDAGSLKGEKLTLLGMEDRLEEATTGHNFDLMDVVDGKGHSTAIFEHHSHKTRVEIDIAQDKNFDKTSSDAVHQVVFEVQDVRVKDI